MRTIARVFPVLAILLLASSASAQDVPDLVLIDVDLHWTVPVYGAISLSGSQEWQNGVGYTDTTKSPSGSGTGGPNDRWHITGVPSGFWVNFPALGPANAGQFVLDLESSQLHGIPHFSVTFDGQLIHPVLLPGDYAIGGAAFGDPGIASNPDFSTKAFFAESGHISVIATPELKLLRRLMPKHLYGREFAALANPRLQLLSAWGATMILRALRIPAVQQGAFITLPSVILEVQEWCSGLVSMKWLLLLGVVIALVTPMGLSWKAVLVLAAPLIALEVNILRIASIGAGIETLGYAGRETLKEWTGWGAMGLGVAQIVGLGWLINRQRARTA